jgi:hypothetical protein
MPDDLRYKLTDDEIREVYALAHGGRFTQQQIADRYKIHQAYVSHIKLGKHRKQLTSEKDNG